LGGALYESGSNRACDVAGDLVHRDHPYRLGAIEMSDYLVLAGIACLMIFPLALAFWRSPQALLWLKRRLVARADGLTAGRAAYNMAYASAMRNQTPEVVRWREIVELDGKR